MIPEGTSRRLVVHPFVAGRDGQSGHGAKGSIECALHIKMIGSQISSPATTTDRR